MTNFSIYNKLNKPLYIDWKKCSFISNENKFDYYIDVERSEQISYYGSYLYRGWLGDVQSGKSASTQTKIKPERITFIPPKSFIYNSKFRIKPGHSYRMTNAIEEEVSISWKNSSSKKTKVKRINLSQNTSKDIFRNFLTFSYSEKFDTEFYIDNNFWVSQVLEMSEKQFVGRKRFEGQKSSCPYNTANGFYIYVDSEPGYFFCN